MDNICHTLTGAAMGAAGLKGKTRWSMPTLMAAANLPDVDALVFLAGTPSVYWRRGWTHGVLAQVFLPVVLTALVVVLDRAFPPRGGGARVRPGAVLALSYAGVLSHVFLDFLNTYGIRLLMPFSGRWFYGDAVFIVDPWLWLTLGVGIWLASRLRAPAAARLALGLSLVYVTGMLGSAVLARRTVLEEWTRTYGRGPRGLMVGPVPINPLRRAVIVDAGNHYRTGTFEWPGGRLMLDDDPVPKNADAAAAMRARADRDVQRVLVWSRFPRFEVTETPVATLVTLTDMRFGPRVGQVTVALDR